MFGIGVAVEMISGLSPCPRLRVFVHLAAGLEHLDEGLLRDVHLADGLHALLALLLLFEELSFAGDVAAVAFGRDVLAKRADAVAGDDLPADGGLERDFEQMAVDFFREAHEQAPAASSSPQSCR